MSIENVVHKHNFVRRTFTLFKNVYLLTEKEYSIDIEILTE